jgi:uncharacterized membrane protein
METLFIISSLVVLATFIYIVYDTSKHFENKLSNEKK